MKNDGGCGGAAAAAASPERERRSSALRSPSTAVCFLPDFRQSIERNVMRSMACTEKGTATASEGKRERRGFFFACAADERSAAIAERVDISSLSLRRRACSLSLSLPGLVATEATGARKREREKARARQAGNSSKQHQPYLGREGKMKTNREVRARESRRESIEKKKKLRSPPLDLRGRDDDVTLSQSASLCRLLSVGAALGSVAEPRARRRDNALL